VPRPECRRHVGWVYTGRNAKPDIPNYNVVPAQAGIHLKAWWPTIHGGKLRSGTACRASSYCCLSAMGFRSGDSVSRPIVLVLPGLAAKPAAMPLAEPCDLAAKTTLKLNEDTVRSHLWQATLWHAISKTRRNF